MKALLASIFIFCGIRSFASPDIWLETYKDQKLVNLSELTKGRALLIVGQDHCENCDKQVDMVIKTPLPDISYKLIWINAAEKPRKSWIGKIAIFVGDQKHLQELGKAPIDGTPTHLVYCKGSLVLQQTGLATIDVIKKWFQRPECKDPV